MTATPDITAVLTAHAEGVLAGPSLVSFEAAISAARASGLTVKGLILLDRPDAATRLQFDGVDGRHSVISTDFGDPALARNAAVEAATGAFVAFLDGDDLWSKDWLWRAHAVCAADPVATVAHSELNVIFGLVRLMYWHVDSSDPGFDADFMRFDNYWDAMSFAARDLYQRHPFAANDRKRGFAHEDWHWNCATLSAGVRHRPVPGTIHFKRRRKGSEIQDSNSVAALPWVTPLASYGWMPPLVEVESEVVPSRRVDAASRHRRK